MHSRTLLLSVLSFVAVSTVLAADMTSPFVGTWIYSETRSHISSGSLPSSSGSTLRIERDGKGFRWANEGQIDGKPMQFSYQFELDGKDYPVTGSPLYDTMAVREIGSSTWETVSKKNGKVYSTSKRTVSKDGKTLTVVSTRPNAKGEQVVWTQVYDRQ